MAALNASAATLREFVTDPGDPTAIRGGGDSGYPNYMSEIQLFAASTSHFPELLILRLLDFREDDGPGLLEFTSRCENLETILFEELMGGRHASIDYFTENPNYSGIEIYVPASNMFDHADEDDLWDVRKGRGSDY